MARYPKRVAQSMHLTVVLVLLDRWIASIALFPEECEELFIHPSSQRHGYARELIDRR